MRPFCSQLEASCLQLSFFTLTFFLRTRKKKKGFSFFFLWGDLVQNRPQNPAPAGCLFSTRKSRSEVAERGDFFLEENCLGKGGADRAKKAKRMHEKRWVLTVVLGSFLFVAVGAFYLQLVLFVRGPQMGGQIRRG